MHLTGLFPIVKRWLGVILMATAMAAVIGAILGATADKTYEAKTELLVGPLNTDSDTMRASGSLAQTYAELATSGTTLRPVAKELDTSTGALAAGVRATANSTTRFLVVRARSHQPEDAAAIANAVTKQLVSLTREGPIRPEGQLLVLEPARTPSRPVSPRLDLIIPLATIAGLLGSLTLVLLFEFVGDTAESTEKVSAATGTPTIPVKRRQSRLGPDGRNGPDPLRVVATQVELAAPDVRSLLLTGVSDQDGTGGLVLDLAALWVERRGNVLVVDAGGGEITEALRLVGGHGLSDLVSGRTDQVTPIEVSPGLYLLTRGTGRTESIQPAQAAALLEHLTASYGMVVVHTASASTSSGALVWGRVADVTVLAARRFHARRAAIEEVATNLRTAEARLALTILDDTGRQASLQAWAERFAAPRPPGPVTAPAPAPNGSPLAVPPNAAADWLRNDLVLTAPAVAPRRSVGPAGGPGNGGSGTAAGNGAGPVPGGQTGDIDLRDGGAW